MGASLSRLFGSSRAADSLVLSTMDYFLGCRYLLCNYLMDGYPLHSYARKCSSISECHGFHAPCGQTGHLLLLRLQLVPENQMPRALGAMAGGSKAKKKQ
jgi:hypothetical protein